MQHSYYGLSSSKTRFFYIIFGAAVLLLLAIIAALVSARSARVEAAKYLRAAASLRVGTAYQASVAQLRDAGVRVMLPNDCERQCILSFYFGSKWRHALQFLPPPTELAGQLEFRDGRLASKLTAMRQSIYIAEVTESVSDVSGTSTDIDSLGRLRRISIELSPLDFTQYRESAYSFSLACMGATRGCKTADFLQKADELEHRTPASIPVRDLVASGRTVEVISRLAMKYHIMAGVYGTSINGYHEPTIDVSIKNGTLGDAFDAIAKADPRLEWRQSNGAVHFATHNFPISLMDVTLHSFDSEDDWHSVLDRLDQTPESQAWLLDNKCPSADRHAAASMGGTGITPTYISVHARDLAFSSVLDQIAAQSGVSYWSVERDSASPCPTRSTWIKE